MTRVLLLIPTASYRAPDFMDAAAKLGLEVVVGSDRGQPLADLFPGKTVTASFADPVRGGAEIARFADSYPLDAIVAVDDGGTILAAEAAAQISLPYSSVEAVRATRDKSLMRTILDDVDVPTPNWRAFPIDVDATALGTLIKYPCVVKPIALSGSRGVMRADDPESFAAAVDRLRAILSDPRVAEECGETADRFLIEDYIPGDEVSLEGLMTDGTLHVLALFDKPDPLVGPFFEETIYVTPSRLDLSTQQTVARIAERAILALGISEGPVHAELRLAHDLIYPIDIAARSIGGLCARTLSFGTGMSLEEIILRHATGAPNETFDRADPAAGVMMIPIPAGGILKGVSGLDAARSEPLISEVKISIPNGQKVTPLPEGGEYLGFIFARGETSEEVEAALRAAHARLDFEIG
jgi:biotin carboxylase